MKEQRIAEAFPFPFFLLCLLKGTQDEVNRQRLHYKTEDILSMVLVFQLELSYETVDFRNFLSTLQSMTLHIRKCKVLDLLQHQLPSWPVIFCSRM
jgi:hypothetical protein